MKNHSSNGSLRTLLPTALLVLLIGCNQQGVALDVFGEKESVGASVYVDSKEVGKMEPFGDGARLAISIVEGDHSVEVKKEGYKTYREELKVKNDVREYYIYAVLVRP